MMNEYRISYDHGSDTLYVRVREGRVAESDEVDDGIIVDYDEGGNIVRIEVLGFLERKMDLNELVTRGLKVLIKA
ncbi:MAG: DUF2283 domain-containing protein [Candidatus Bathyarchaeia archaeon]